MRRGFWIAAAIVVWLAIIVAGALITALVMHAVEIGEWKYAFNVLFGAVATYVAVGVGERAFA